MNILIGNFFSLLAMITDSISSSRKTARGVLVVQSVSQVLYCTSSIALKGYSAAAQNVVSIFRNVMAISKIQSKTVEWITVILGVVLGLMFNNLGLVGLLPVIANLEYTLAVFRFRDNERMLKIAFLICVFMFTVFDFIIMNFVGVASHVVIVFMLISSLVKTRKREE